MCITDKGTRQGQKLAQLIKVSEVHPSSSPLAYLQLGRCWFLSRATEGPLCRELDWWYVPLELVQHEPQLDLLLHGVELVPAGMTFHHPNSDILEQGYTEKFLVMVNNLSWRISW